MTNKKPRMSPEMRAYLRAIAALGGQRGGPARAAALKTKKKTRPA
jgi:hypothetical protein